MDLVQLLTVIGRINPAIWDAIIPMGPKYAVSVAHASKASEVELNPQPIPPGHELLFASARVAHEIANAAIAAEAAGSEAAGRIVSNAINDWCGTPHPHRPIPWPGPWPFPWLSHDGIQDPTPNPWDIGASRVVGALSLAAVAAQLEEGEAKEALANGADQLLEAGMSVGTASIVA
jgi:hypothetical protein